MDKKITVKFTGGREGVLVPESFRAIYLGLRRRLKMIESWFGGSSCVEYDARAGFDSKEDTTIDFAFYRAGSRFWCRIQG